jgi:alpha-1,2-mannosyltransferase
MPLLLYPIVLVGLLAGTVHSRTPAFDFDTFRHASSQALHGLDPYPLPRAALLRLQNQFVYPAPALAVFVPFALIPSGLAYGIWLGLSAAALVAAAAVFGIRDWRVFALLLAPPVAFHALLLGTITPVLVLGVALLWRWRDRLWPAAALAAAVICFKLYLVPLVIWLAVTGRRGSAVRATALAVLATGAAWAAIGFAGLADYPHVLSMLSGLEQRRGFSAVALYLALGAPVRVAQALALVQAGTMCGAAAVLARRADERGAFCLSLAAAMALLPIVWLDFFLLLLTPLLLYRHRPHPLWVAPMAFLLFPHDVSGGVLWRLLLWNAVAGVVLAVGVSTRARVAMRIEAAPPPPVQLPGRSREDRAAAA